MSSESGYELRRRPAERHQPRRYQAGRTCEYCGVELNPLYYFCTQCATPYKPEKSVLPRVEPRNWTIGQLITKRAPAVTPVFWTYFVAVIGAALLGLLLGSKPGHLMIAQTVVLLVTTCVVAGLYWQSLVPQLKRIGFDKAEAWAGLALLVPLLGLNFVYHGFFLELLGYEGAVGYDYLGLGMPAMIILMCVFPAIVEEIAFRGLVQHWLEGALPAFKAIAVAAALFTALHFSIYSAPYLFLVGLLLGWVRWKTGSLYPVILMHFLHNFVVISVF